MDGTLLEFADRPDAVRPSAALPGVLNRLAVLLDGALALVSGRTIGDLDAIFAPLQLPAAGQHGLERRDAGGRLHKADIAHALDDIRAPLQRFAACHAGALLEDKGSALALHYRQTPAIEGEARDLVLALTASRDELHCLDGKMVFEIKSRIVDKGVAVRCFMDEAPFAGRMPVFIGDDVTDEDGFRFVNESGGLSVRVGAAPVSAAHCAVPDVGSVLDWLRAVADGLDKDRP